MLSLETFTQQFADIVWGTPLVAELWGITLTANAFYGEMGGAGARAARVCRADTEHHHHVYRLVLRRQMLWVFSRRSVAALLSLVLCSGGDLWRNRQHRCGLQPDFGELWADGDPHDDQLYRAGSESSRSKPRLFRGALLKGLSIGYSRNLRVAGWQLEDQ